MKKSITACLLATLVFSSIGCTSAPTAEETAVPTTSIAETEQTIPETTIQEETAPDDSGYLFFSVSEIVFSLVGDSEDIYLGSIPAEEITWGSNDENIALFKDGILTATGIGSTTVYAQSGDQQLECKVSCLAQTEEALMALGDEILRTPKRYPFIVEDWPEDFYNDSAFVGDSITYTLWHTAGKPGNELANVTFLVKGGTSINGFVKNYKNIYYQGKEMHLDDAIAASGVKKVFFMMGQNDLGYMTIEDTMANWTALLERIFALSPDVEIYIQSLVPEWNETHLGHEKNEKIDQYNEVLKTYCEENGYHFIEIASFIEDHANKMATVYSMDSGIHINYDGTDVWMDALKAYAKLHVLRGE